MVDICNERMGEPYRKCRDAFSRAVDDCRYGIVLVLSVKRKKADFKIKFAKICNITVVRLPIHWGDPIYQGCGNAESNKITPAWHFYIHGNRKQFISHFFTLITSNNSQENAVGTAAHSETN